MSKKNDLKKAAELFQAHDFSSAEAIVNAMLLADKVDADAMHLLGLIKLSLGQADRALSFLAKACEISPGNAAFLSDYARALSGNNRAAEAAGVLGRAVVAGTADPRLHFLLAGALAALGNIAEARGALEAAVALSPDYFDARVNLSELCKAQGDLFASEIHLKAALALRPLWAEGRNSLGLLYEKSRNDEGAFAEFARAVQLAPAYAEALNNLGMMVAKKGDIPGAMELYRSALRHKPDFPEAHYNLGNALRDMEELDAAIASFRAALRVRPLFSEALSNLGEALDRTGDYEAAEACFESLVAAEGRNARAFSSLLCVLNYDPRFGPPALYERHRRFDAVVTPAPGAPLVRPGRTGDSRKLRIGYVSGRPPKPPRCPIREAHLSESRPFAFRDFLLFGSRKAGFGNRLFQTSIRQMDRCLFPGRRSASAAYLERRHRHPCGSLGSQSRKPPRGVCSAARARLR